MRYCSSEIIINIFYFGYNNKINNINNKKNYIIYYLLSNSFIITSVSFRVQMFYPLQKIHFIYSECFGRTISQSRTFTNPGVGVKLFKNPIV